MNIWEDPDGYDGTEPPPPRKRGRLVGWFEGLTETQVVCGVLVISLCMLGVTYIVDSITTVILLRGFTCR